MSTPTTPSNPSGDTPQEAEPGRTRKAGAFDIRVFIGALIGFYGLVLVAVGLVGTDSHQLAKSDGLNINLWAGLGMIVAAAAFIGWARLRPVVVPVDPDAGSDATSEESGAGH